MICGKIDVLNIHASDVWLDFIRLIDRGYAKFQIDDLRDEFFWKWVHINEIRGFGALLTLRFQAYLL